MSAPTFVPTEQWARQPEPKGAANKPPSGLYHAIVIHHSAGPLSEAAKANPLAAFKQVESAALGRKNKAGKPLFSMIPYSYLLHMQSGVLGIGRGMSYGDGGTKITHPIADRGGHTIRQGETLSICVAGNYQEGKLTVNNIHMGHLQNAILAVLFRHANRMAEGWSLIRHRDVSATACPGNLLAKSVLAIRPDVYAGRLWQDEQPAKDATTRAVEAGLLPRGSNPDDPVRMSDLAHLALALAGKR